MEWEKDFERQFYTIQIASEPFEDYIKRLKQFITTLLQKERIDTLKAVLPEEVKLILRGKDGKEFNATKELGVGSIGKGFNNCRDEVIKKAKELWNIDLTK